MDMKQICKIISLASSTLYLLFVGGGGKERVR
jgi:hypothetical protein